MELHAALHAAPARFTTWDSLSPPPVSTRISWSAHGSVGFQREERRRRFGSPVISISRHAPLRDHCRDPFADPSTPAPSALPPPTATMFQQSTEFQMDFMITKLAGHQSIYNPLHPRLTPLQLLHPLTFLHCFFPIKRFGLLQLQ